MEWPSLQRLLWQASLIRLRAGRFNGIDTVKGEWSSYWDGVSWFGGSYELDRWKMFDSGAVGRGILFLDAKALWDYGGKYHHCACFVRIKYKGLSDEPYQKGIGVTEAESTSLVASKSNHDNEIRNPKKRFFIPSICADNAMTDPNSIISCEAYQALWNPPWIEFFQRSNSPQSTPNTYVPLVLSMILTLRVFVLLPGLALAHLYLV